MSKRVYAGLAGVFMAGVAGLVALDNAPDNFKQCGMSADGDTLIETNAGNIGIGKNWAVYEQRDGSSLCAPKGNNSAGEFLKFDETMVYRYKPTPGGPS